MLPNFDRRTSNIYHRFLNLPYASPRKINVSYSIPQQNEIHDPCDQEKMLHIGSDQDFSQVDIEEPAFLMLTSGSTGNAKAVCLSHYQVLSAVRGKASVRTVPEGRPFLNWIGLDHVASLVEIHLLALWVDVGQIYVHAADVMASPTTYLDLLSKHGVSRSFAPNFFLARLVSSVKSLSSEKSWDLRGLTMITSGGEMNNVETCIAASEILQRHGAPKNVIVPGFGMTETCAGAIFNLKCPEYDIRIGGPVASLGRCIPGIKMRVSNATSTREISEISTNQIGYLEVCGDVVFRQYYRNPEATIAAFTPDGWFRTDDKAAIDNDGNLNLLGRTKDITNINGVKFQSDEIQGALEKSLKGHVARVLGFPSRDRHTERVTVAYIPNQWPMPTDELIKIDEIATQACVMSTGSRPSIFALSSESVSMLPTTSLGKVSRNRMRSLFEMGFFQHDLDFHNKLVQAFRHNNLESAASAIESGLAEDFAQTLNLETSTFGMGTSLFELNCTSMDLIRLKHRIDSRMHVKVPVILLMKHPTIRSLAVALAPYLDSSMTLPERPNIVEYDPVITLRSGGTRTPLWLVHPGVGEVLVFVGLAKHFNDRPVYALRAKGFEPGQERFASISEVVETYLKAIREQQSHGPYALAGYSYGAMLAFEVAKRLEEEDGASAVRFLGSFNLPPHIKSRMRYLNWNMCLLHLAYFLGLVTEEEADGCEGEAFRAITKRTALEQVLAMADEIRLDELKLGEPEIARWVDVAFGLQSMAVDYEPRGTVSSIDVFHAAPLKVAAASREEWFSQHLSKWTEFCRTEPRLHAVEGAHYTMLGPEHVFSFSVTLQGALDSRGV
ncbi:hypothetical protein GQX73_g10464 [Xylaria multiplex]|uniref:Carrier domain-containing protein n=1 Tax=Xylaria multiplex TaxID=323545 RepID=A0A7C8MZW2_9PEZI|nr:hypothetical protein GQX73_g10464 [Xylaria multiplex]